jgi:F-type H+-transporting ATPase subunit b
MKMLTRLSLSVALVLSPLSLLGQGHEAQHAETPAQEATVQVHEAPAPEGHGENAPAAHEGAGHGEANAEGHGVAHHGPAMKLFGKEYGNLGAFLVQLLNFAIYAAALIFLLKGVLSAMFKSRKEELEALLSQSERDKAEGEAQVKALEAKMAGLEGELAGILAKAETDAEAEKQRVLEAARTEAGLILAQAQSEIDHQKRQAEQELRALVAELAVEGAAQRLAQKLQGPEAGKALDRAIQQIGGVQ